MADAGPDWSEVLQGWSARPAGLLPLGESCRRLEALLTCEPAEMRRVAAALRCPAGMRGPGRGGWAERRAEGGLDEENGERRSRKRRRGEGGEGGDAGESGRRRPQGEEEVGGSGEDGPGTVAAGARQANGIGGGDWSETPPRTPASGPPLTKPRRIDTRGGSTRGAPGHCGPDLEAKGGAQVGMAPDAVLEASTSFGRAEIASRAEWVPFQGTMCGGVVTIPRLVEVDEPECAAEPQTCQDNGGDGGTCKTPEKRAPGPTSVRPLPQVSVWELWSERRLNLVLDLDHTLVNSCLAKDINGDAERQLREFLDLEQCRQPPRTLFQLQGGVLWTKLRPFVHQFLDGVRGLYRVHLYTMGQREYGEDMARLLDPTGEIVSSRLISRCDVDRGGLKHLDEIPGGDTAAVVVDDMHSVWPEHKANLLRVERYHYFPWSEDANCQCLLTKRADEDALGGQLSIMLQVLQKIHSRYFMEASPETADVRRVIGAIRSEVLAGVHVLFSGVIPLNHVAPQQHRYWRLAEELGAKVSQAVGAEVTHVIAAIDGTEKVTWARSAGRFVVRPGWLDCCECLWKHADESDFTFAQDLG
eukprot:evm.model.scf_393EXC.6 EVM.evm.TU.scf_393EXC.6   scf_393EXC:46628-48955(-)